MRTVSGFEGNLLRVLHGLLGRAPMESVVALVQAPMPRPRGLQPNAIALVQESLAKGCVQWLARAGWQRGRYLRGERPMEGRLWERTPPSELALRFSRHSLSFLLWLTSKRPVGGSLAWDAPAGELTPADRLLLFLAHETLRGTGAAAGIRALSAVRTNVLCRLAYPQDFVHEPPLVVADFLPWTSGLASCILEAMQSHLARCWVEVEIAKRHIQDWELMQSLGRVQEQTLAPFFEAVHRAGRLDLARFVLAANRRLLPAGARPEDWIGGLTSAGPRLADRTATHRAALAFVRQIDRLRQWERQARSVGYLDEGYAAAQLWKQDWEHFDGDMLHARAQALVQQLEPLASPGGAEA
jgi:hypothetical protein